MTRLIDADSAAKEISRFVGYLDDDMILRLQIAIKRLPMIDAVPVVHGHWENTPIPIWMRNNTTRTYYFKCNKCSSTSWNRDNYCSHCGAKMDEVTE